MTKPDSYHSARRDDDCDDFESDPCFQAFSKDMRADLAPSGTLETFLVERVIVTAWRLKLAQEDLGVEPDDSDSRLERLENRAEKAMYQALAALEKARTQRERRWGKAAAAASKAANATARTRSTATCEETATGTATMTATGPSASKRTVTTKSKPSDAAQSTESGGETIDRPLAWRERLAMDPSVSTESPVVKGTKLTVSQVVSFIVDGQSWEQILKDHPELSEDDVRACLAYAVEEEDDGFTAE